jgi:hypothetical protein
MGTGLARCRRSQHKSGGGGAEARLREDPHGGMAAPTPSGRRDTPPRFSQDHPWFLLIAKIYQVDRGLRQEGQESGCLSGLMFKLPRLLLL